MKKLFLSSTIIATFGLCLIFSSKAWAATKTSELELETAKPKQEMIEKRQQLRENFAGKKEAVEEKKEQVKELKMELKTEMENKREQAKEMIQVRRQEMKVSIAQHHAARIQHRFIEVYYPRLLKLIAKLETHLSQTTKDVDIEAAQTKLDQAEVELETAKDLAQQAISQLSTVSQEEIEENVAQQVKDTVAQAHNGFKTAKQLIKDAIELIK